MKNKLLIFFIALSGCSHPLTEPELPMINDGPPLNVTLLPLPKSSITLPTRKKTLRFDFWHLQEPDSLTFGLALSCRLGAQEEPKGKEGLASVTLELMRRATLNSSQADLIEAIEGEAAELSTTVTYEASGFILSGPVAHFDDLTKRLQEVVLTPRFDPLDFKTIQDNLISQSIQVLYEPSELSRMTSNLHFYNQGRLRIPVTGSVPSLQKLDLEDAISFAERFRQCSQWTISVISPWSTQRAGQKVRQQFKSLLKPSKVKKVASGQLTKTIDKSALHLVVIGNIEQAHIVIRKRLFKRTDPQYAALVLANEILGGPFSSRLNTELRQKLNLTYGVNSFLTNNKELTDFQIYLSSDWKKTNLAIESTLQVWKQFTTEGPTEQELIKAKNYIQGRTPFAYQDKADILSTVQFYDWVGLPLTEFKQFPVKLQQVTPKEIQAVLQTSLNQDNISITVIGSEALEPSLKKLSWPMTKLNSVDYLTESPYQSPL